MRIGRTLPPAASPLHLRDIFSGLQGLLSGRNAEIRLTQEFCAYFQTKHCFFVSSGKAALTLILLALKDLHPERDQVLIPAFACYSVPSAVVRVGLHIQVCDIDLATLDFDFDQLQEKLANPRLLCVIPMHLFGLPADVERIRRLNPDPTVAIVEDAAQAMGGQWQGKKLGTQGDVGFFSLGRGKALTAVEGGVILTDDDALSEHVQHLLHSLPACGAKVIAQQLLYSLVLMVFLRPELYWLPSGMPFLHLGETRFDPDFPLRRFSAFQAGLLKGFQENLTKLWKTRRSNATFWAEHLGKLAVKKVMQETSVLDLLRFPVQVSGNLHDLIMQPRIRSALGLARTYPDAINGIGELRQNFVGQEFPKAQQATREILTLPVHEFLASKDREMIIRLLNGEKNANKEGQA